jgi:hypothetical protein
LGVGLFSKYAAKILVLILASLASSGVGKIDSKLGYPVKVILIFSCGLKLLECFSLLVVRETRFLGFSETRFFEKTGFLKSVS